MIPEMSSMSSDPAAASRTAAFTGHRTYCGQADALLGRLLEQLYGRGFRTFLSGMAVGFDLAAAEAVAALRVRHPDVRLVAVVPFRGQERRFRSADRTRWERIVAEADAVEFLAEGYHPGCYAVRNRHLVARASLVVAWYDGSPGGTQYTVREALRGGRELINLHPDVQLSVRPVDPPLLKRPALPSFRFRVPMPVPVPSLFPPGPSSAPSEHEKPRKLRASGVSLRVLRGPYFQLRILWKSYSSGLATYFFAAS